MYVVRYKLISPYKCILSPATGNAVAPCRLRSQGGLLYTTVYVIAPEPGNREVDDQTRRMNNGQPWLLSQLTDAQLIYRQLINISRLPAILPFSDQRSGGATTLPEAGRGVNLSVAAQNHLITECLPRSRFYRTCNRYLVLCNVSSSRSSCSVH
ncbi:hypothetical protein J6590_034202 [Homalodisca vitripennis]|nr:hypothetical protein J6590_034202 [Homalodisca vitripennis]